MSPLQLLGHWLAHYLSKPGRGEIRPATCSPEILAATLRKGDVLLVESSSRFSTAIKYLTQSTWSHAALYVGDALGPSGPGQEARVLVEADVEEGVRAVALSACSALHTRICRPVGLSEKEIDAVVTYMLSRIGYQYDLKNVIDLARYLIQTPPVPTRWRRRMLALGSGDPTRAICSSLVAQAFQSVRYPILPEIVVSKSNDPNCKNCYDEYFHIRHHSLFAPRDFDLSPYFQIVKPTLEADFDHRAFNWIDPERAAELEDAAGTQAAQDP